MDYQWQAALTAAIKKNRRDAHHRYLQLATVRADGSPANRTLVFRGFLEGTERLQMVTDARSEKRLQLTDDKRAELCWYFTASREQFRLRGVLELVDADHALFNDARERLWHALSPAAQAQFFWPAPGLPVSVAESDDTVAKRSSEDVPTHFMLLLFEPLTVDHLRLKAMPQQRVISRRTEDLWQAEAVNP